jgi:hypothetical protein
MSTETRQSALNFVPLPLILFPNEQGANPMYRQSMILLTAIAVSAVLSGCATQRAPKPAPAKSKAVPQQPQVKPVKADVYYDVAGKRWRTWDGQGCRSCTPQDGYSTPVVKDDDMYYDPAIKKWRQSSLKGEVCHTCTPQYGYPVPPR